MPPRRRAKHRKGIIMCSTPVDTGNRRASRISLSTIDTNSSSDGGARKRKALKSEISARKRNTKQQKRAKVGLETAKENKRSKSKNASPATNYDSDWSTASEQASYFQQDSPSSDTVLFKDLQEPECVREADHVLDDQLNTSLLEHRHTEDEELEKIGVEIDLPSVSHLPWRVDCTDDEEEEFVLAIRKEDKPKKYPGKTPKKPVSSKLKSTQWLKAEPLKKLRPDLKIPPILVRRGTINRQSRKWVRQNVYKRIRTYPNVFDVYEIPDSEDDEYESMSFREYSRKRKAEKEKMLCSKRAKTEPKCKIISIETLTDFRCIKHGENWKFIRNSHD